MSSTKSKSKNKEGTQTSVSLEYSFKRLREHAKNPYSASVRASRRREKLDDQLALFKAWPGNEKPTNISEEDAQIIRRDPKSKYGVSNRSKAKYDLEEYEFNMFVHTFKNSSYEEESEGKRERMHFYFIRDKLGLKTIGTEDTNCWKAMTVASANPAAATPVAPTQPGSASGGASASKKKTKKKKKKSKDGGTPQTASASLASSATPAPVQTGTGTVVQPAKQPVKTLFYRDLEAMQRNYYKYLRASIVLYMDDAAKDLYNTFIDKADDRLNLSKEEKYLPGKRISWKDIKEFILEEICVDTLGNYYYRPLLTLYRQDKQTRFDWCKQVENIQEGVHHFGQGYDKIGTRDFVDKLWDWLLDEDEKRPILKYYRETATPRRDSEKELLRHVALPDLIETITLRMKTTDFGDTVFMRSLCPEANAKLLYEHSYVEGLKDKLARARKLRDWCGSYTRHP